VELRDQRLVLFCGREQQKAAPAGFRMAAAGLINIECKMWRELLAVITATRGFWLRLDPCGKIWPS